LENLTNETAWSIAGTLILKRIFKSRAWTGFNWLRDKAHWKVRTVINLNEFLDQFSD
jgi:hypothetical protein